MLNQSKLFTACAILAAGACGSTIALAQHIAARTALTVMTPNVLEGAVGNSDWYMGWETKYSVQVFVASSQLMSIPVGSEITGMSFRCSPRSSAFPLADVNMARFDVTLSPSVFSPLNVSATFADNIGPGAVQVRSGAMVIPAGAFPASPNLVTPSLNAWYVPFTSVFVYPGGDLCVTFRAEGVISNSGLFDGYAFGPIAEGSALYNYGNSDGTEGSRYGPIGIRFSFALSDECPGDLNLDGQVDDADFVIFLAAYNILDCADPAMPAGCPSDLNGDGVVEDGDFVIFLAQYNALLCP